VATTWSARRAISGRSYVVVVDAFLTLFAQIPFPILELHPDNGAEFLNDHLIHFLETYHPHIFLSRTHRGRSNDNRYVEPKNRTLARAYLGRARLDTVKQTRYLNRIYELMGRYYNYLQPLLHLNSPLLFAASMMSHARRWIGCVRIELLQTCAHRCARRKPRLIS